MITAHPHYPEWRIREGYGGWIRRETVAGVPITRMRHYVPKKPSGLRRLLSELSFGVRLLFARWGNPDVVLLVSPTLFSTAVAAIRVHWGIRKPALGIWVQDLYSLGVIETGTGGAWIARLMTRVESSTLKSATGVAVIHERFKSFVVARLGVNDSDVVVIRNWSHLPTVPLPDRASVRHSRGWGEDEIVVLHAGNMGAKQALENVVHAARLTDERAVKLRFVLLGDGNRRSRLEELAEGVRRIEFIDPLPDDQFQQVLASADILLVNEKPGVLEMAVPSKITSYFSTGLPVIAATDRGSVTAGEIESSGGGIRIDAGHPEQLVDAALTLARDHELCHTLGEAGKRFRESHLSQDAAIDRYAQWLCSLAAARGR